MKIKSVVVNSRKKRLDIVTSSHRALSLPFSKLPLLPTVSNKITDVYVDKELGSQFVTYRLASGKEDSVPLDAFLEYNQDLDYIKNTVLYKLTVQALTLMEKSALSKREVARRLHTSAAQLYRLLDTTNTTKTIDQMVKLIASLGYEMSIQLKALTPVASLDIPRHAA